MNVLFVLAHGTEHGVGAILVIKVVCVLSMSRIVVLAHEWISFST